jgi:hypothetical protein
MGRGEARKGVERGRICGKGEGARRGVWVFGEEVFREGESSERGRGVERAEKAWR